LIVLQNISLNTLTNEWNLFADQQKSFVVGLFHTTPQPFYGLFRDHAGDLVPEENFWTLWCKGRLTEADTLTIWLGATPSGLISAQVYTLFNAVYAFVT